MRKLLAFTSCLVAGVGALYYTSPTVKSKVDQWIESTFHKHYEGDDLIEAEDSVKLPQGKFDHLDKYARETPEANAKSISAPAYLGKAGKNDLEKARLLYTWIATHIRYDDKAYNTEEYKSQDAERILKKRVAVCEGYSNLFKAVGDAMNLKVEKILGYAKGYGHKPGSRFSETNHAWNAVQVDSVWRLMDATWANGYGVSSEHGIKSVVRFDPYWFDVPPEEFVFSHLPESSEWQLNDEVITLKQYEKLPAVDESLFQLGVNGKDVFQLATTQKKVSFPETFSSEYPVTVIQTPLQGTLLKGTEYAFHFDAPYYHKLAIIDDGEWIYMKKEDSRFSINYAPRGKNLKIVVVKKGTKSGITIFIYRVADAPKYPNAS